MGQEPERHRVTLVLRADSVERCAEALGRGRVGRRPGVLGRAALRIVAENKSHFFTTPEAAWEWLESTGRTSGCTAERNVPVLRSKRNRARRALKRGEVGAGPVTHALDLEQLIHERREAIHSAAAISASPVASESETEILQPPSDRPITPDRLSGWGGVLMRARL
ncbi:hypothetical protein NDU88_008677 [Pleurodeles waltl]|uniref:Uncharacterized protein n=1 Tax=Pleurodeles waltl TaxID=8319 RepID=A0AAV7RTT1_PLEWA|nr:hypothetical protein NDU88_008677 [Pleurodeles waltl]